MVNIFRPFVDRPSYFVMSGDLEKTGGLITEELREKLIGRLVMVLGAGTDEECAICLESLNVPVITHCAHVFCRPCIESVIQNERVS